MKLYRAVPITMFSPTCHKNPHSEDVYFSSDLLTINHKHAKEWEDQNDLASYAIHNGKYFFFFPEHAIALGSDIYRNEYLLKLIEYDMPDDIVFVLTGDGYYAAGNGTRSFPEALIYYQNIPGFIINSQTINHVDKVTMLKKSLYETYFRLQKISSYSEYHNIPFEEFFINLCQNDNKPPLGLNHLNQFLLESINLIKVENINQRSWTINTDVNSYTPFFTKNPIFEENKQYLSDNGLHLQLSEQAENARINFNVNGIMGCNITLAKTLLKEYHEKFPN